MTYQTNPGVDSTEPIAGEPLITAPEPSDAVPMAEMAPPVAEPVPPAADPRPAASAPSENEAARKVKTAAVVAGAAALANKVRKEAPKVVNQLRERRMAGRCVIITEVDGRFLTIGPYKNEDAARDRVFKVGGNPHVAEIVSDTTFFMPPEKP
jgi:hypothetical protein